MSTIDFTGRVALVTGAGRGLGRTYALELARRGAQVVVNDPGGARDGAGRDAAVADQVVAQIRDAGGTAVPDQHGVDTPEGGAACVARAIEAFGRLDVVVHNAGILRDRSFAKMTQAEWDAVLGVHLHGGFHVLRPAWTQMREQVYGRIVVTTSVSGLFGNFGQANYGAAKMGLVGLIKTLAIEGAKYNITANAVSPIARTRMTDDLPRESWPEADRAPEHVTPAVVYLASEACDDSGVIVQAGQGYVGRVEIAFNEGAFLGAAPVSAETFAERWPALRGVEKLQAESDEERYVQRVYRLTSGG